VNSYSVWGSPFIITPRSIDTHNIKGKVVPVPKPEAVIAYRGVKKPPLVLDLGTSGQFHCLASSPTEYENGWPQSLSEDSSEEIVSAWNRTSVVL